MTIDLDWEAEYLERLKDRFTSEDLCEELELTVEELFEAFYDLIIENRKLLEEVGLEKNG